MMSQAQLEAYRRMTPEERIREMRCLIDVSERSLRARGPEEARRRLEANDRMRRESKEAFLGGLERMRQSGGPTTIR